jgi:hypothetical protein
MASTAAMASGVTTQCAWTGPGESVIKLTLFRNFLLHSYTCCSDRHASPYWTSICRWISMGFTTLRLKNEWQNAVPLWCMLEVGPPTLHYCYTVVMHSSIILHLSATLQTISITVANIQDNRVVFQIFITFLRFSFDPPSYYEKAHNLYSSQNIVWELKQTMRYVGYVACMVNGFVHSFCSRNPNGKTPFGRPKHRRWETLKQIVKKHDRGQGLDSASGQTCGRLQQTWWTFGFGKMCRVCQIANKLLASQVRIYYIHLCKEKPTSCIFYTNISRCMVNKT